MTDAQIRELHDRNLARVEVVKAQMGTRYLMHPQNKVTRKAAVPSVLQRTDILKSLHDIKNLVTV